MQYRLVIALLCGLIYSGAAAGGGPSGAVLPFDNLSGVNQFVKQGVRGKVDKYAEFCRQAIEEGLVRAGIELVDRSRLDSALEEMEFGASPLATPDSARRFGELVSARILIRGTILPASKRQASFRVGKQKRTTRAIGTSIQIKICDVKSATILYIGSYPGVATYEGSDKGKQASGDLMLSALEQALSRASTDQRLLTACRAVPDPDSARGAMVTLPFDNLSGTTASVNKLTTDRAGRPRLKRTDRYAELVRMLVEEILVSSRAGPVVERDRIDQVLEELELSGSSLVSNETVQEIGHMLSARILVTGSIAPANTREEMSKLGKVRQIRRSVDTALRIKATEVESGRILFTKSYAGHAEYFGPGTNHKATGDLLRNALLDAASKAACDPELLTFLTTSVTETEYAQTEGENR